MHLEALAPFLPIAMVLFMATRGIQRERNAAEYLRRTIVFLAFGSLILSAVIGSFTVLWAAFAVVGVLFVAWLMLVFRVSARRAAGTGR